MARTTTLLVNNPFIADSRAWKMARSLSDAGERVTIIARADGQNPEQQELDGFNVVRVAPPPTGRARGIPGLPGSGEMRLGGIPVRLARDTLGRLVQAARYLIHARRWARVIEQVAPPTDIWQAEGLVVLPVALELRRRRGGVVVYDSRDIHVEQGRMARLPGPWRSLLRWRERQWARSADAFITVSDPYADVLEKTLGRRPEVVWNGPPLTERADSPERIFHQRLGLDPGVQVVLYLGKTIADRGIPELCQAIGGVPLAVLVIAGLGDRFEAYRTFAASLDHADRIYFLPSVEPAQIPAWTAAADVSAMPVQGRTLNLRLNTPTKLFDAMGAGVPVVASDIPGIGAIVRETGCGVLCDPDSPPDIARAIREILEASPERRGAFRSAALAGAQRYSWERQAATLVAVHERVMGGGP
jgi:glycosyltransferase involved in cell wall biosynthesis